MYHYANIQGSYFTVNSDKKCVTKSSQWVLFNAIINAILPKGSPIDHLGGGRGEKRPPKNRSNPPQKNKIHSRGSPEMPHAQVGSKKTFGGSPKKKLFAEICTCPPK